MSKDNYVQPLSVYPGVKHIEVLDDLSAFRFLLHYMVGWSIATSEQKSMDRMLKGFTGHNPDLSHDQLAIINKVRKELVI